ncbi:hypothetical protein B0H14DRAFT_2577087 [Mycena olivaceomarginata]|nr:hypothetical protein B0H14DRAFT_2577087 [Mycena olivaceomarginata]
MFFAPVAAWQGIDSLQSQQLHCLSSALSGATTINISLLDIRSLGIAGESEGPAHTIGTSRADLVANVIYVASNPDSFPRFGSHLVARMGRSAGNGGKDKLEHSWEDDTRPESVNRSRCNEMDIALECTREGPRPSDYLRWLFKGGGRVQLKRLWENGEDRSNEPDGFACKVSSPRRLVMRG